MIWWRCSGGDLVRALIAVIEWQVVHGVGRVVGVGVDSDLLNACDVDVRVVVAYFLLLGFDDMHSCPHVVWRWCVVLDNPIKLILRLDVLDILLELFKVRRKGCPVLSRGPLDVQG